VSDEELLMQYASSGHSTSQGLRSQQSAINTFRHAWTKGKWLIFENCHLSPSIVHSVELLLESLPNDCHPQFRI